MEERLDKSKVAGASGGNAAATVSGSGVGDLASAGIL